MPLRKYGMKYGMKQNICNIVYTVTQLTFWNVVNMHVMLYQIDVWKFNFLNMPTAMSSNIFVVVISDVCSFTEHFNAMGHYFYLFLYVSWMNKVTALEYSGTPFSYLF